MWSEITPVGSPVCRVRWATPQHVLRHSLKQWAGDGPEKWRKIGDRKEDLRGIPVCEAEIGNWAVVITGCGIDVVPINQNCWINKNCSRFFCHGAVQKMFQTLSPSIARYVPIPTAMSWQNLCLRVLMQFFPLFFTLPSFLQLCSAHTIYMHTFAILCLFCTD